MIDKVHRSLGIRKATLLALSAYLPSVSGSADLQLNILPDRLPESFASNDGCFIDTVDARRALSVTSTPVGQNVKKQKSWDRPLCMVTVQHVKMAVNTQADVARLSAVSSAHPSGYLNVYPSSSVGTRFGDSSLWIAITLRLDARICEPYIILHL